MLLAPSLAGRSGGSGHCTKQNLPELPFLGVCFRYPPARKHPPPRGEKQPAPGLAACLLAALRAWPPRRRPWGALITHQLSTFS